MRQQHAGREEIAAGLEEDRRIVREVVRQLATIARGDGIDAIRLNSQGFQVHFAGDQPPIDVPFQNPHAKRLLGELLGYIEIVPAATFTEDRQEGLRFILANLLAIRSALEISQAENPNQYFYHSESDLGVIPLRKKGDHQRGIVGFSVRLHSDLGISGDRRPMWRAVTDLHAGLEENPLPRGRMGKMAVALAAAGIIALGTASLIRNRKIPPSSQPAITQPASIGNRMLRYDSVEEIFAAHPELHGAQVTVLPHTLTRWYGTPTALQNPMSAQLIRDAEAILGAISWQPFDSSQALFSGDVVVGAGELEWPANMPEGAVYLDLSTPQNLSGALQQIAPQLLGQGSLGPYSIFPLSNGRTALFWYA